MSVANVDREAQPCCECGHCNGVDFPLPMEAWAVAGHGDLTRIAVHDGHVGEYENGPYAIERHQGWAAIGARETWLMRLDRWRHKIPFWWWLTYDAAVALVIIFGVRAVDDPWFWIGFAVLGVAVVIDTVEFIVKRPSAKERLGR